MQKDAAAPREAPVPGQRPTFVLAEITEMNVGNASDKRRSKYRRQ